eukprot:tig00020930_g16025.t1
MAGASTSGGLAVCTGASDGIGFAIARRLCLELQMRVLLVARRPAELQAAANRINTEAGRELARAHPADVTDGAQLAALEELVRAQSEPLRVVVNSAGSFMWDDDAGGGGAAAVRARLLAVNYESKRNLVDLLLPSMAQGGVVVNIGSQAGQPGFKEAMEAREGPGATDNERGYMESMALVRAWSEGRGGEACGARGVRALLFEPGLVDTPLARRD